MIDPKTLLAAGISGSRLAVFGPLFDQHCDITDPEALAGFLANVSHESAGFSRLEENLNYSAEALVRLWPRRVSPAVAQVIARRPQAIANTIYANRMGNGDAASGDGWRYRGRGGIQMTGEANYEAASLATGIDFLSDPDRVAQPEGAVITAVWFWNSTGCNDLIPDRVNVRKRINGSLIGMDEVNALWTRVRATL